MPHGVTSDLEQISTRMHDFWCKEAMYTKTFLDELGCRKTSGRVHRIYELRQFETDLRADPPGSASPTPAKSPCFVHHAPSAQRSLPPRSHRRVPPPAKPRELPSPATAASVPSVSLVESSTASLRRPHANRLSAHQSSLPGPLPSS